MTGGVQPKKKRKKELRGEIGEGYNTINDRSGQKREEGQGRGGSGTWGAFRAKPGNRGEKRQTWHGTTKV